METRQYRVQSGFALLIFVVVLMGIGGIALTGFAQKSIKEVQKARFNHNKEILEKAKHALLMYAYRYPDFNLQGPGRLPCPYDEENGYSGSVSAAICDKVGRLPRLNADLNFENEAKDASGEYLWYAVSGEFRNVAASDFGVSANGDDVVNSDSLGTISIFDQTGNLIYDGAANGVAAVIISPGTPLAGQDRNADPLDPENYLDSFDGFDNSLFVNASNADDDGFRLGPVTDNTTNTIVINDEFVIITADEIVAMAEKAVLQSYRNAINLYQHNNWGTTTADYRYPWLNDYVQIASTDIDTYDVDPLTSLHAGRIPSIFSEYFTDEDSEQVFSEINLTYDLSFTIGEAGYLAEFDGAYSVVGNNVIGRSSLGFRDINTGQLVSMNGTTSGGGYTGPIRYFWDDNANIDGWELCPDSGENENDCNQTIPGTFVVDPSVDPNLADIRILKVTLRTDFDFDGDTTFQFDYSTPLPAINYLPPTAISHAKIRAVFDPGKVTVVNGFVHYDYERDDDYIDDDFNPNDPTDGSRGTISATSVSGSFAAFDITLDYFPELPDWAGRDENNWNSSIMLAYDDDFEPGGSGICTVGTCLDPIQGKAMPNDNVVSLLIHASAIPVDSADLELIFEGENNVPYEQRNTGLNSVFNANPEPGDDFILILEDI